MGGASDVGGSFTPLKAEWKEKTTAETPGTLQHWESQQGLKEIAVKNAPEEALRDIEEDFTHETPETVLLPSSEEATAAINTPRVDVEGKEGLEYLESTHREAVEKLSARVQRGAITEKEAAVLQKDLERGLEDTKQELTQQTLKEYHTLTSRMEFYKPGWKENLDKVTSRLGSLGMIHGQTGWVSKSSEEGQKELARLAGLPKTRGGRGKKSNSSYESPKLFNAIAPLGPAINETDEYIDVPVVAMKEGVFRGTDGKARLKKFDNFKNDAIWLNYQPILDDHLGPFEEVMPDTRRLGHLMNMLPAPTTRDVRGIGRFFKNVLTPVEADKVRSGKPFDGSISYRATITPEQGVFNNDQYEEIEGPNYVFYHYAVVPRGACSSEQGCGFNPKSQDADGVEMTPEMIERLSKMEKMIEEFGKKLDAVMAAIPQPQPKVLEVDKVIVGGEPPKNDEPPKEDATKEPPKEEPPKEEECPKEEKVDGKCPEKEEPPKEDAAPKEEPPKEEPPKEEECPEEEKVDGKCPEKEEPPKEDAAPTTPSSEELAKIKSDVVPPVETAPPLVPPTKEDAATEDVPPVKMDAAMVATIAAKNKENFGKLLNAANGPQVPTVFEKHWTEAKSDPLAWLAAHPKLLNAAKEETKPVGKEHASEPVDHAIEVAKKLKETLYSVGRD